MVLPIPDLNQLERRSTAGGTHGPCSLLSWKVSPRAGSGECPREMDDLTNLERLQFICQLQSWTILPKAAEEASRQRPILNT